MQMRLETLLLAISLGLTACAPSRYDVELPPERKEAYDQPSKNAVKAFLREYRRVRRLNPETQGMVIVGRLEERALDVRQYGVFGVTQEERNELGVAFLRLGMAYRGQARDIATIEKGRRVTRSLKLSLRYFELAEALGADPVDVTFEAGLTYDALGESNKAKECFDRVFEQNPSYPGIGALVER